jgi:hypothetical protein
MGSNPIPGTYQKFHKGQILGFVSPLARDEARVSVYVTSV